MRIKQSVCVPMFPWNGLPLEEIVPALAGMGYAALEIWGRNDFEFEKLVELTGKHGMSIASIVGHGHLDDGLSKAENHDRIEVELRESIDVAVAHGIPGLICFSGNRNEGQSDEEGLEVCAAGIRRVIPYAEEKGINLNLELLNSRNDHPGYLCDRTDLGVALCKLVDSSRFKLLYDIYHMQIMEGDIIKRITENIEYIGHFHTAGVPGRKDMDDEQELNYRGICNAIAATDYNLFLGHEYVPRGDTLESLKTAFKICDQS